MIFGINIALLLALVLPPLLYAGLIYLTSPYKSIDIKRGLYHIMAGFTSVFILSIIFLVIPSWSGSSVDFLNTFFFIAPKEELVKLLVFLTLGGVASRSSEHPVATMFYMGMVGLGFSLVENIQYVMIYGEEVLLTRMFTATIAHMLFGMFMGYWIAKGNINNGRGNRSVFGVLMGNNLRLKRNIYVLLGWLAAVGYHGLWNYNLMISTQAYPGFSDISSTPIMIMLIFFGLVGAKFASKDLNDSYRMRLKNTKPKKVSKKSKS